MGSKSKEGVKVPKTANEIYARNLDRDIYGLMRKLETFSRDLKSQELFEAANNLQKARLEVQKFMDPDDVAHP